MTSTIDPAGAGDGGRREPNLVSRRRFFRLPEKSGLTPARAGLIGLLISVGVGARWALQPVLGQHAIYLTIYPFILLAAVLWGKLPGVIAGLVGLLSADLIFGGPLARLSWSGAAGVSFIVVVGSALFWGHIGDRLRASEAAFRATAASATAAEQALRESESRYRTLFTSMDEGFQLCELIHDADGRPIDFRFLDVNPAFERHTGLPRERVVGHRMREVLPHNEPYWFEAYARVAATGEPLRFQRYSEAVGRWYDVFAFSPANNRFAAISVDVTERKQAENELQRSRDTLQGVVDAAPAAVIVAAADGRIVTASRVTERIFGGPVTGDAHAPSGGYQLCSPDGTPIPNGQLPLSAALRGLEVREAEILVIRSDGTRATILASATPLRSKNGQTQGAICVFQDITERKATERALEESESQLRLLADAIPQLVWITTADGRQTYLNKQWLDTTGMSIEQALGFGWAELLHPDDHDRTLERWQRSLRTGEPFSVEYRFMCIREAQYRWFLGRALPVRNEAGAIVRWFGTCTDIHDQKQAEAEVSEAKRRLEVILANLPVGVIIADADGRIIELNDRARDIWGARVYAQQTADYAQYRGYWPGTRRQLTANEWALARALERGETVVGEVVDIDRFDGRVATILNNAAPFRDSDGQITGAVVVILDITESRRNEQALRAANVVLRESEARLREADSRKNEFLAMLSHELRNPLAPIRNSVYVLERAVAGSEQATRARQVIERQVQHMTRLIDDLLDVTRISKGKIALQRERLDLNALARGVAEDHREVFARNGVHLDVIPSSHALYVDGDPTRLAQVIGNLLSNAAKFTPAGGHATLEADSTLEGMAVVRVRDSGVGMSAETLEHIFEPFVQAERTLERSRGGLGLGLALAKGLIEMHGGRVEAHSEGIGTGSEMTVFLPLATAVKPRLALMAGQSDPSPTRRVLVIEDNLDAADSLKEALELSGHQVFLAHTGPDGIERAGALKPDVVLCDIGLPEIDGYGVARALRADPALQTTVLVALSGYALPEDVAKSMAAGFDRHMAKPPSIEALEKLLAEAPAREPIESAAHPDVV